MFISVGVAGTGGPVEALMEEIDEALLAASERYDFVLVPGLYDSGPEHWQSHWQRRHSFWRRISQSKWDDPDIERWISAIRRDLATARHPAILVGHSLGALASCCIAAEGEYLVAGLMLVAPAQPSKFHVEDRVPQSNLGVPSVIVASRNDRLMPFERAIHWTGVWGGHLVDVGEVGHINAEAGFGPWPYGVELLKALVDRVDAWDDSLDSAYCDISGDGRQPAAG
ncbi:RBBP9/YdeN family alpha/beta hydrolase [Consotaella salsifontis]|uniref:Alpha/beta hydrolase n=1 Tax=Consotaella salsifontis TaxID=1365950 RepID=A0A1T4MQM0_9HYPH|nr:alpha/beta hydrolase [Consotaella salsifontis]SJZ69410.1 hypothetical protein SAMN05428963_102244 [Consotaella salsifontis]